MAKITLKGNPFKTIGKLPKIGKKAPKFSLIKADLSKGKLKDFEGSKVILNIFPSLDTGTCAASVRKFNEEGALVEVQCSHCKKFKSISEFSKNKTQIDGLETKCKVCKQAK